MFGWRRRSEGFEWREYVRTTVLVRRADRQRKIDDARMAALASAKDARDRGVAASRAAAESASNHLVEIAKALASAAWSAIIGFTATARRTAQSAVRALVGAFAEKFPAIKMPEIPRPEWRLLSRGMGGAKRAARMLPDVGFRLPININKRMIGGAAAVLGIILIGGPMLSSSEGVTVSRLVPGVAAPASTATLSGRAVAISGDLLRVDGSVVRLAGIETPEPNQPCFKSNGRRWNCGTSARSALEKILRAGHADCARSGQDVGGTVLATCKINDTDIAEALVRGGHVFATSGLFASYSAAETEARGGEIGLWQGEAVRPKEWRDQIWEEAKKAAPEGCPIKGFVRASDRLYTMPWSQDYVGAKVRAVKGGRWFCSEDEARAAGFKLANRS